MWEMSTICIYEKIPPINENIWDTLVRVVRTDGKLVIPARRLRNTIMYMKFLRFKAFVEDYEVTMSTTATYIECMHTSVFWAFDQLVFM